MRYKLFIPGASGANDKHLHERGLGDLCRDTGAEWESTRGPDEKRSAGMVASWKSGVQGMDAPDGVPTDGWEWTPSPPCGDRPKGDYWLGVNSEARPRPVELLRKTPMPGVDVELADGMKWSIPIARGMPYSVGIDYDTGEPTPIVDERFRNYSARTFQHATLLAEREDQLSTLQDIYFGTRLNDEELSTLYFQNRARFAAINTYEDMDRELSVAILFDEALEHSIDALSINYRLNQFMILHFRLFEVSTKKNHLRDICLAAMEAQEIVETLKKNGEGRLISLLDG